MQFSGHKTRFSYETNAAILNYQNNITHVCAPGLPNCLNGVDWGLGAKAGASERDRWRARRS